MNVLPKQIFTSWLALVASIDIKPAFLPIILTKPTPYSAPLLSTYPLFKALTLSFDI